MARLLLTGMIAATIGIVGCQQTKLGHDSQPAAPRQSATPPPRPIPGPPPIYNTPPPPPPTFNNPPPPPPTYNNPPPPPPTYNNPPPPPPTGGNPPPPNNNPPSEPPVVPPTVSNPPPNNNPPPVNTPPTQTPVPPNLTPPPPVSEWYDVPQPIPQQPVLNQGGQTIQVVQPPPQVLMTPAPSLPPVPMSKVEFGQPLPPAAQPEPNYETAQLPLKPLNTLIQPEPNYEKAQLPLKPLKTLVNAPKPECQDIPLDAKLDTNKLDILFVIDTSASMRGGKRIGMGGELGKIAREMDVFAKQLDSATDFHIGMILGHAPSNGSSNLSGVLFRADSSDPAVIQFSKVKRECGGSAQHARDCALTKIGKMLEYKMRHLPTDHTDAQGEALMLSLYNFAVAKKSDALSDDNRTEHFPRKGAILSVIPISDEQDVCYNYDTCVEDKSITDADKRAAEQKFRCTPAQVKIRDAKGKVIGAGSDPHEVRFYNSVCKSAVNGGPLTPGNVVQALIDLKGGDISKLAVNPVVYMDNNLPRGVDDENEMGHGYIEMTQLAQGKVANLAAVDRSGDRITFSKQLELMGKFADAKMRFSAALPFVCKSDIHPSAVNLDSMDVQIIDGKTHKVVAEFNGTDGVNGIHPGIAMDGNGQYPHILIGVKSETLSDTLKASGFQSGVVKIKFKTRTDYTTDGYPAMPTDI